MNIKKIELKLDSRNQYYLNFITENNCVAEIHSLTDGQLKMDISYPNISNKPIAILNTSIITANGTFKTSEIDINIARMLVQNNDFISAIGHAATANLISELLNIECPVNRINFQQDIGQLALIFKLKERQPEGAILSLDMLEKVGYDLLLMERLK